MKHERDASGHWLAGLSDPMVSMRDFLQAHDELIRRQARRMGLNATDMQTLRLLDLHGPLGPTELARRLDLKTASVTVVLDRLEAAGHVERIRDERDRRRVTVRALPQALDLLFDTWAPVVRALDDIARGLTPAQRSGVCAFFDGAAAVIAQTPES
ncbi:MarR family transcriptional regulator [Mycolicibacterium madagascariense]|uniref:MarR family transcriptional regulator n=1 Tax=Mycolicibacterium madagascariense TaxID=212765 RepID=A0A7I7XG00_9MYCO|nr:MarR family winged helix-turn-helix transcriptional regulator [Mycolicibacterium madagascariense]MCV7014748.1 winged helix-turn-helix transcriptional regulator [Mycolicibacterium madagascariense]BBZ28140.1 MarR family transcriptional regulator [Mycolicibacterium madagascariense]